MSIVQDEAVRIMMFHEGRLVPRLPLTPVLSSAGMGWTHFALEQHRLEPVGQLTGAIDGYQIYLFLTGPVVIYSKVGGRECSKAMAPREMCTATHGEFTSIRWDQAFDCVVFRISAKRMAQLSEEKGDGKTVELVKHYGLRDSNIENILRLLRADVAAGSRYGPVFGEQLGMALAVYLFERYSVARPKTSRADSRLPGKALHDVLAYIEERIAEPIAVEELAGQVKLSRFYFARLFQKSMGASPAQYILDRRMHHAKRLLEKRGMSIGEVARACGFPTQSHFAAAFHGRNGFTPSKYRSMSR